MDSTSLALWVVSGLVLAGLLVLVGGWLWRARRQRRPDVEVVQRPGLRHPIVLAHGVMGFDEVQVAGTRHQYFRGLDSHLKPLGTEVVRVRVPASGSVSERAEALARAVRSLSAERVNIIAHSMGGLDARYAISRLGLSAKVASLTTLGTPHQGTPLADLGTRWLGDRIGLRKICEALGIPVEAFYDLTTERMRRFNADVPDAPQVRYGCMLAAISGPTAVNPLLVPSYLLLSRKHGKNDGLVPASSQTWGEVLGQVDADHWAQVGWALRFDAGTLYASLVRSLKERGL